MKLTVVLSRVPWPLDKGDKLRAYYQIRELSKNHEINLIALNDKALHKGAINELSQFCSNIEVIKLSKWCILGNIIRAFFIGKPLQVGYFYSKSAHKKIQSSIQNSKPDQLYGQLVRVAEYLIDEKYPRTLDFQDALSAGLARRAKQSKGIKRFIFNLEYKRMLAYESEVLDRLDHCTIITKQDQELIQSAKSNQICVVPNGVDITFFKPMNAEKVNDIVFTGNMNYPPNVMAAKFLALEIIPYLKKKQPNIKLLIAGASPHASVKALASENVVVSGWLDDIRTAYSSSKVFVAPMQIGTGLQNKLLEAMAMKIPSVTSVLANRALGAIPEQEIKVADSTDAKAFADQILYLLENEADASTQAERAYTFIKKNYSWASSVQLLEELWN